MDFHFQSPHPCSLAESQLMLQCRLSFARRGGPGGQHRNKVESAVVVTHSPSQVIAEANERRDQSQNRRVGIARLRRQLAWVVRSCWVEPLIAKNRTAVELKSDTFPKVSSLWQERCIVKGGAVSVDHWDYATLLAEALDHLVAKGWQLSEAAQTLGVSTARLGKFLKIDPATLEWVNRQRQQLGFPKLR